MSMATTSRHSEAGLVERTAIIAVMAVGSIAMWLGVPLGLIYAVSKTVKTTQPQLGPYLIILIGVPIGMTIIGRGLGALDRHYTRRTGGMPERYRAGWMRSMRAERKPEHVKHWKVLDLVMLWSVAMAGLAMGVWFFFFAGSPL